MSPTRMVILAVLFYLLYRLLIGPKKKVNASAVRRETADGVDDVLVEDSVCHVLVPKKEARTIEKEGKTFYFCSDKCKNLFKQGAEE